MTQLESIKDTQLIRDRVYEMLRKEILVGGFTAGEPLNILGISKQLGVSSAPIREAINMLSKDGLVELMPYKKAVVADGTDEDYNIAYDIRLMLEPYALSKSINDIPDREIAEVRKELEELYANPTDLADFFTTDSHLHDMLYHYCDSKLIITTLDNVRTYTMRYYTKRFNTIIAAKKELLGRDDMDESTVVKAETAEHIAILDAVEARDGEKAASLLKDHISGYVELFHLNLKY